MATESLKEELGKVLSEAKDNGWISESEIRFLGNENPKIASFYMLPTIHKCLENPPGTPVISGNESLTEPVSKYIDYSIKRFLTLLPAFVQDTTDVLNKVEELQNITVDVEALYTNIDHQQGPEALTHFLSLQPANGMPPTDILVSLTELDFN